MGCIVLSGHIHKIVITMQETVHAIIHAIALVRVYRRCDLTIRVHSHRETAKAKLFFDVSYQSMQIHSQSHITGCRWEAKRRLILCHTNAVMVSNEYQAKEDVQEVRRIPLPQTKKVSNV